MSFKRKEWKNTSSRRAKVWRKMNGDYEPIPTPLKTVIVATLLILMVLVPAFFYWNYNVAPYQNPPNGGCPSGHTPRNGICAINDPYTLLWNGTIYNTPGQGSATSFGWAGGGCPNTNTNVASMSVTQNDEIVARLFTTGTLGGGDGMTDSQGNAYTLQFSASQTATDGAINAVKIFTAKASSSGTDTFSFTLFSSAVCTVDWVAFHGVTGVDANAVFSSNTPGNSGSDTQTITTSATSVILVEGLDSTNGVNNACYATTDGSGQTDIRDSCFFNTFNSERAKIMFTLNSKSGTVSWSAGTSTNGQALVHWVLGLDTVSLCPAGYSCLNSVATSNGDIQLNANASFAGEMLTTSTITTATAASKELLFFETWNGISLATGAPFGWYLTTNNTLPNNAGYSPLNDPSVVMATVVYTGSSVKNYYNYQQKEAGDLFITTSGLGTNPYPNCLQTSTLYDCNGGANSALGSSFLGMSMVLNFTGSGGSGSSGVGGQSASILCTDTTPVTLSTYCSSLTTPPTISPCTNGANCGTYAFPFMNVQGRYYLGFWSAAGQTGTVSFGARSSGALDKRANGVYYWVPSPACPPTCAQTDTGGFFGWLGRTFGGAVNTVFKTIQNVGTWVQNTALGPIGDVLQGMISWMITQLVNFINWVGGTFLGNSSLGTQLLTAFNNIIGIVTKVLTDYATWFVNFGNFVISGVNLGISIFANAVVFGIFAFFAGSFVTLISIVLTVLTTFFSYVVPTSYLLMMDWIWGILLVYVIGVSGFLWWADINVQIFTFLFKMIWKFITAVWSTIVIIKSFIPTEGGTPPEVTNPIPSGGGKGGEGSQSGSQGRPSPGHKGPKTPRGIGQGAKDGDPFAIVVMGFMILVVLFWLSQSAFSPIPTVQTAGCYAWSTSCHVQNGITVGSIDTTVFFAYLFSQQHGIVVLFSVFIPLTVIMIARWFMKNVVGESQEENMFFNWGRNETVERIQTTRSPTSRRETMRRLRRRRT